MRLALGRNLRHRSERSSEPKKTFNIQHSTLNTEGLPGG
jgi:hypothetical protein